MKLALLFSLALTVFTPAHAAANERAEALGQAYRNCWELVGHHSQGLNTACRFGAKMAIILDTPQAAYNECHKTYRDFNLAHSLVSMCKEGVTFYHLAKRD